MEDKLSSNNQPGVDIEMKNEENNSLSANNQVSAVSMLSDMYNEGIIDKQNVSV